MTFQALAILNLHFLSWVATDDLHRGVAGVQNHLAKFRWKISSLGKVSWMGCLSFERVQILKEMELICTYHSSLHQDEIMAEIWKQQSGFYSENCTKQ